MKTYRGGTKLSKFRNTLLILVMALVMVLGNGFFVAQRAYAETQSGTVGVNGVPWTFDDETGALIIGSENNETTIDYEVTENHIWPWDQYKEQVKSVEFVGTVSVYNASWMFAGCKELETFNPDNFETRQATNMTSMFKGDAKLSDMRVLTLAIPSTVEVRDMYFGCYALEIEFWKGLSNDTRELNAFDSGFGSYIDAIRSTLKRITSPEGNGIEPYDYPDAAQLGRDTESIINGYNDKQRVIEGAKESARERLISYYNNIASSQEYLDLTDAQKGELTRIKEEGLAGIDNAPYPREEQILGEFRQRLNVIFQLMQAQNAAVAGLTTTYNEIRETDRFEDLTSEESTTLSNILEEGVAAIYNTGNLPGIEATTQQYQDMLQNVFNLMIDKKDAVAEIEVYRTNKSNDDYYANEISILDSILSQAITDINNANAINAIETIVTQAKADMDAVKTKEQIDFENAKAALKDAIDEAAALKAENYMDDSFAALTSAVTAGQSVYDNSESTLAQIRDATAAITEARANLAQAVYVTFESNGGTPVATAKIAKGDSVARPDPAPDKEGFNFDAWYKDDGVFTELHNFGEAVNSNLTLYANWTRITFEVKFESNGGTVIDAQPVDYGAKVTEPAPPTKEGFDFGGWYTDEKFEFRYNFDEAVYKHLTLYAKWAEKQTGDNNTETPTVTTPETPAVVTPETPAPAAAVDAIIAKTSGEGDVKGSTYAPLQLQSKKQSKSSVTLKWSKVKGATQYVIYGNKCGKGSKYQKLATVSGSKKSYVVKKILKAKIKKGTDYKFVVYAVKGDQAIAVSKSIHVTTSGHKKKVNHTKVTVSKKVTTQAKKLKKGKSLNLKAKAAFKKGKKVVGHVKPVRYESSNKKIATVNAKGKVKGVKKGTCYIYAYAQNGICKKIKITVK